MTRLRTGQIRGIGSNLQAYDARLFKVTGSSLKQIAMQAVGISPEDMEKALASSTVAVVSITCGEGVIEGFTEAVCDILTYLGARVLRSKESNISGIAEAIKKGAEVLFCADDQRFVAIRLSLKRVIDNAEATARGYVEALESASGGLREREVLVIGGAGRVGWHAALWLEKKGAYVSVYDIDEDRLTLPKGSEIRVERDLEKALRRHRILFDATPASDIVGVEHVTPETIVAAPGIPLGLTEGARGLIRDRLIHDPLQIGVATMLSEVVST
jgi:pyrrolysine biosynthesis protein PylD